MASLIRSFWYNSRDLTVGLSAYLGAWPRAWVSDCVVFYKTFWLIILEFFSTMFWPMWGAQTYLLKSLVSCYYIKIALQPVSIVCGLAVNLVSLVSIVWYLSQDLLVNLAGWLVPWPLSGNSYCFGIWKDYFKRNFWKINSPTFIKNIWSLSKKEIIFKKKTSRRCCKFC